MPIQAADSKAVRVAGFCVHLDAREVRRDDGSLVPLQDKPFSVLAVLLERPGELVTRDDLRQRLWPGDTFVDFEHGINTAVRKLREALADSAEQPRIIETLPRRGYRCIAQVAAPNAPVARERILMLPFANLNGEREDPLSYALTERMTAQLGRVCKTIDVLAPLSVLHARDAQTADTIRRELHADYALTGSFLCADGQIRITAKLICCADQRCVWSESYTRPGHEIFAVQDNITRNIARAIAKVFSHEEENAANARLNTTSAVYVKYLVARHWNQSCSVGGFLKAKEQAEAVIHDDPEFAPAYGFLALLHATLAAWGVVAGAQAYPQVEAWARRGLALSKRLEEAECALGWKLLDWDADFAEAERHLHRAIEINPSFPLPHILAGQSAAAQGKHSKASAAIERALELDPVSPQANTTAGCIYYLAGGHPKACVTQSFAWTSKGGIGWRSALALRSREHSLSGFSR